MKYANRYGDERSIWYRRGDNLYVEGRGYFVIEDLIDVPQVILNLGNIAAGTIAAPTQGAKVQATELEPRVQKEIVHTLVGVDAVRFAVGVTASVGAPPAAVLDEAISRSCQIRAWNPAEQPLWLSPQGNIQGFLTHEISPVGDENELFPVFTEKDNPPTFRADNPWTDGAIQQYLYLLSKRYLLEELPDRPDKFATIKITSREQTCMK